MAIRVCYIGSSEPQSLPLASGYEEQFLKDWESYLVTGKQTAAQYPFTHAQRRVSINLAAISYIVIDSGAPRTLEGGG